MFRKLILLSFLLFSSLKLVAQSSDVYSAEEVKAALLVQVARHLNWPEHNQNDNFSIAVWNDRRTFQSLRALDGVTVHEQQIIVQLVTKFDDLNSANLVYIPSSQLDAQTEVAFTLRGKGALIVTENSDSLYNTMINLVVEEEESQLSSPRFDVNRPNIVFEGIEIAPELLLFGGSEVDIAELYYQTELAKQALREQNAQAFEQLRTQQQKLADKESEFTLLAQRADALTSELTAKQQILSDNESRLNSLLERLAAADEGNAQALRELERKAQELSVAERSLNQYSADIESQKTLLFDLQQEVRNTRRELSEQQEELQRRQDQLTRAESEVETQSKVIDQQRSLINVILLIFTIVVVSAVIIVNLFLKNRRINLALKNTLSDLTETQAQLIESEKLASLGQLVTGVAHEVNTPLGIALTAVSTIGSDVKTFKDKMLEGTLKKSDVTLFTDRLQELDTLVQGNLERCHALVQDFKKVSADQVFSESRIVFVKEYCENVMNTLSVLLSKNNVEWSVEGDNPELNLDPGILSQVLSNLTTNAVNHAFEDIDYRKVSVKIEDGKGSIAIIFSDNGMGMKDDVLARIYDPFFTTKRGDGGTGLGMNIVHNLVTAKLFGNISAHSEIGRGTTITIELPKKVQKGTL